MRNIILCLRYDGSFFHGWQIQPNGLSVQQCVCDAVRQITGSDGRVTGCSRTDAGVHADMFVCTVQSNTALSCDRLKKALNAVLPDAVAVTHCTEGKQSFHPRYDCKEKTYRYVIWNAEEKNPFLINRAYHCKYPIDEGLLDKQAKDFIGTHDFSAFCAAASCVQDKTRTVYACQVERQGETVSVTVRGNGFLYNMVRIMVGTLLDINSGRITHGSIPAIILSRDRQKAGVTAPACGLYLEKVDYGEDITL